MCWLAKERWNLMRTNVNLYVKNVLFSWRWVLNLLISARVWFYYLTGIWCKIWESALLPVGRAWWVARHHVWDDWIWLTKNGAKVTVLLYFTSGFPNAVVSHTLYRHTCSALGSQLRRGYIFEAFTEPCIGGVDPYFCGECLQWGLERYHRGHLAIEGVLASGSLKFRPELRREGWTLRGWLAACKTEPAECRMGDWHGWRLDRKLISGPVHGGPRGSILGGRCILAKRFSQRWGIWINVFNSTASTSVIYASVISLFMMMWCYCIARVMQKLGYHVTWCSRSSIVPLFFDPALEWILWQIDSNNASIEICLSTC